MSGKDAVRSQRKSSVENVGIGLDQNVRKKSAESLDVILADEYILLVKARNYHWNVQGPMFNDLHAFFESVYDELNLIVDEIAERIRQVGGRAPGTMSEFKNLGKINEEPGLIKTDREMVNDLLSGYETIIKEIRSRIVEEEDHRDEGTAHMLVDIMVKQEKRAWMLRSMVTGWD